MREFLDVLLPLLRGEPAKVAGEEYRVQLALDVPDREAVPVLLAALGDRMLELAGRRTAGTILWMTGPRTIESHIAPKLRAAARAAGRPEPRIVAGMHITLTAQRGAAEAKLGRTLALYSQMPSYRAMLEKEGSARPEDLALFGDEKSLDAGLARLRDLGVTDFEASILPVAAGDEARTLAYLESRLQAGGGRAP
jgi:alkanesulfonate monooxygenase SsuD/methylene tetrahydromethanopterin reductase-like flavin-dependent oxidoreductase (luciferase family)